MDEGLQGAGHQVVVMVEEAWVAVVFALEQVLVVAAGVELPGERRCLRHVVLRGATQDTAGRSGSAEASAVFFRQVLTQLSRLKKIFKWKKKTAGRHNKCETAEEVWRSGRENGSDAVDSLPAVDASGEFLGLFPAVGLFPSAEGRVIRFEKCGCNFIFKSNNFHLMTFQSLRSSFCVQMRPHG